MAARPLDAGIDQIHSLLVKMGRLADDSLKLSVKGFLSGEDTYVQIRTWSNTIQILSEEVEDKATELMTLHQPMARDLRRLKAYIKVAYDVERFGRYSLDIAELMREVGEWKPLPESRITEMAEKATQVVSLSVKYVETMNENLIWEISRVETDVDDLYSLALPAISVAEQEKPVTIIGNILTVRYLERIADHACYIAESVSYAVTGKRVTLR